MPDLVCTAAEICDSDEEIQAAQMNHRWLYPDTLDTVAAVPKMVAFYVGEHNWVIPHSALGALTPDEMYFGTGAHARN